MAWGKARCPNGGSLSPGGLPVPIPIPADSLWPAAGGEARRTLPGTASSQQVSGLRLGQRYTFTIRPLLGSSPGAETSVSERPGTICCRWGGDTGPVMALYWWSPHPFPWQSAGTPEVTSFSWCTAPVTAPPAPRPCAASSPTPSPPWGAWALMAPRLGVCHGGCRPCPFRS